MCVCVCVNIKPSLYHLFQARKFAATGDVERAKRFDKYSFGFVIPSVVFFILTVILAALSPIVGVTFFIIWLVGIVCNACLNAYCSCYT